MIWFTADQHFSHENVILYCDRPFGSINKMNQVLISNYRKVVNPDDTVYFIGDLTLAGPMRRYAVESIIQQLPGRKILILGNHDKLDPFTYVDIGFESVHTMLDIGDYILVHDPAIANTNLSRNWLCGHVHKLFKVAENKRVVNVGVDMWDFAPVSISDIQRLL